MKLYILTRKGGTLKKYLPNVVTDFNKFLSWLPLDKWVAHDLETTISDTLFGREMLTAAYFYDNTVWVLFLEELTHPEQKALNEVMSKGQFIIQNVAFEIKEWRKRGVELHKFYCTMLSEKLINMGLDETRNDLGTIINRYTGNLVDKTLQTSFKNCSTINDEQIVYIAKDVMYLHEIKRAQKAYMDNHDFTLHKALKEKKHLGLNKTNFWNHEFIKVITDLEYQGIRLDKETWEKLYEEAVPKVAEAEIILNKIVERDFYSRAIAYKFIYAEDEFSEKLFTSAIQKKTLLNILYPDITETSEMKLKEYLKANDPEWPVYLKPTSPNVNIFLSAIDPAQPKYIALKLLLLRQYEAVKQLYYINFKDKLIELGLLTPKGTININWASPAQRLEIFRWIDPEIVSTDKPHMEEVAYKHELLSTYLTDYQKYVGMITKFGISYIEAIEADGRVRTRINPILNTGRISSSSVNLLNIINDKRYRACFIAAEGKKFVMTDYQSEELVLTAHYAKEAAWLESIKAGYDLHSMNASKIFLKEWKEAELPDCAFALTKSKCKCPEHVILRNHSKSVSFGAIYGLSKYGLAFNIKVDVDVADRILTDFFKVSPNVKAFLGTMAKFALSNTYSPELVLGACRFVDRKKFHYDKPSIARTASNFAIQGAGASILKIATVLIRRHSKIMGHDAVPVLIPYDEIVIEVSEQWAEYWKVKLQYYMELAGKLALGNDLLKTDTPVIADHWIH